MIQESGINQTPIKFGARLRIKYNGFVISLIIAAAIITVPVLILGMIASQLHINITNGELVPGLGQVLILIGILSIPIYSWRVFSQKIVIHKDYVKIQTIFNTQIIKKQEIGSVGQTMVLKKYAKPIAISKVIVNLTNGQSIEIDLEAFSYKDSSYLLSVLNSWTTSKS